MLRGRDSGHMLRGMRLGAAARLLLGLGFVSVCFSQSQEQGQRLAGSRTPKARPEREVGRMSGARQLHGVTIDLKRRPEQQAELEGLLAQQQDAHSAQYRHWLTPQEFGRRFGASDEAIATVREWIESAGLRVEEIPQSRNHIRFGGSVANLERALQVGMRHYAVGGETHFANNAEPEVPAAVAGVASAVRNLDDFRPKSRVRAQMVHPGFTSGLSGN